MAKTDKRSSQDDVAKIAWRAWTIRFVPLFIIALIALIQFGYFNAFPVVFAMLLNIEVLRISSQMK